MMQKDILNLRDKAIKQLANKCAGFYLGGGTALSLYYFNHRESYDLDFFTKKISEDDIDELMQCLATQLKKKLIRESSVANAKMAKVLKYYIGDNKDNSLKIDFIEDHFRCFESDKNINGIDIMSLNSLYIRKIYAFAGIIPKLDPVGRSIPAGGRQSAKDIFDLYHLSHSYETLSKFCHEHFEKNERDMIGVKSRAISRFDLSCELLDIETSQDIDTKKIIHEILNNQIEKMVLMELD
ncbi:MAG: putative nucleotidyltransferase component of viral defense system [Candidatus Omnitrophota bacterium]|jgi:predicted nucleotidyltransferase component of viral defense system